MGEADPLDHRDPGPLRSPPGFPPPSCPRPHRAPCVRHGEIRGVAVTPAPTTVPPRRRGPRNQAALPIAAAGPPPPRGNGRAPSTITTPRRRPGSSWETLLTKRSPRLLQPPQLDPGLRRGGIGYGARLVREMTATPTSAGERAGGHPLTIIITPAKAGVQLENGANGAQPPVTATSPTGPRPSPGW